MEVQPVFLDKLSTEIRVSYVRAGLRDYLKPRAYITVSWRRRNEGMELGWNSVFLDGKQFAFMWDRASCGSGLDFLSSVTTCRVTNIPAGISLLESPVRFWAGKPAGLFVAVFSSVCLPKQILKKYHFRLLHSSSCLSSPFMSNALWSAVPPNTGRLQANET
jgi:hypothetical protein